MIFFIAGPIQYRAANGTLRFYDPGAEPPGATQILDAAVPAWDLPSPFVDVPLLNLRPMDAEAKAALDAARAPYAGRIWPGLGYVEPDEQIFVP